MQVCLSPEGSTAVVKPCGELDISRKRDLEQAIEACATSALTVVDLVDVTFLDCAVVGVLVDAAMRCRVQGHDFTVMNVVGMPATVLRLLGVAGVLSVDAVGPPVEVIQAIYAA